MNTQMCAIEDLNLTFIKTWRWGSQATFLRLEQFSQVCAKNYMTRKFGPIFSSKFTKKLPFFKFDSRQKTFVLSGWVNWKFQCLPTITNYLMERFSMQCCGEDVSMDMIFIEFLLVFVVLQIKVMLDALTFGIARLTACKPWLKKFMTATQTWKKNDRDEKTKISSAFPKVRIEGHSFIHSRIFKSKSKRNRIIWNPSWNY